MSIDLEKWPKHYDINECAWSSEGEWRKAMVLVYTGSAKQ